MSKWYVEFMAYGKRKYMGQIEAEDGNKAIEEVRSRVIGVNKIIGVWHDDEDTEGGE